MNKVEREEIKKLKQEIKTLRELTKETYEDLQLWKVLVKSMATVIEEHLC